jgi:hypothetical protein
LVRKVDAHITKLLNAALEPVQTELHSLNAKMDRILDINIAPDVLRDFRIHNESLRAIQADCDLLREMNPLFDSFLRHLITMQLTCEDLAEQLERREPPAAASTAEQFQDRDAA